jgi:hypothetical protein
MRTFLKRVRGVVVSSVIWALIWGLAGASVVLSHVVRNDLWRSGELWHVFPRATLGFALLGGFSGAVFAIALTAFERRRTLDQLAMGRVAAWGALGGMALPLIGVGLAAASQFWSLEVLGPMLLLCTIMGGLGAGCSTVTLALARRPPSAVDPA